MDPPHPLRFAYIGARNGWGQPLGVDLEASGTASAVIHWGGCWEQQRGSNGGLLAWEVVDVGTTYTRYSILDTRSSGSHRMQHIGSGFLLRCVTR
jgi:hypothetical protein